jgi:hypothetical protein
MFLDRVGHTSWCMGLLIVAGLGSRTCHAQAQPCNRWSDMFPADGGLELPVNALSVHSGELYLGGEFAACMGAGMTVSYTARWNGHRWARVGAGTADGGPVYALGTGGSGILYAGAEDGVHREPNDPDDPNEPWSLVGITDGPVYALAMYQGSLYAGGAFTCIRTPDPADPNAPCDPNDPNQVRYYIARWDGAAWEDVGGGLVGDANDPLSPAKVSALTVFDDGGGEALFVGGTFTYAGPPPYTLTTNRIARWKDGTWSAIGNGIREPANAEVDALAGWPGGALYVGGRMTEVGDEVAAYGIAAAQRDPNDQWTWSSVNGGVWFAENVPGIVACLTVLEAGATHQLYAGGRFQRVGGWSAGIDARHIAVLDDQGQWAALGGGFSPVGLWWSPPMVRAVSAYNDGFGSALYVAGNFAQAGDLMAPKVARFKGGKWSPLGRAPNWPVYAFCDTDDWHRPRLFVGGGFQNVGDLKTGGLASWDGVAWTGIGLANVNSLCMFEEGNGPDLFVGGGDPLTTNDQEEDEGPTGFIARGRMVPSDPNDTACNRWHWVWTNTAEPNDPNVPVVTTSSDQSAAVRALAAFQDPDDPNDPNDPCDPLPMLYAAGKFTVIDGRPARYVARLNLVDPVDPDHPWEEVGDPNDAAHPQGFMRALTVCLDPNDGQAALYAGGTGGVYQWRDGKWSAVGEDLPLILALAVYQDANDPQPLLYAGGDNFLKKWTGAGWSALDDTPISGPVFALRVYDDGTGPGLYAGGEYPFPGTTRMARWDGAGPWEYLANDANDHVWALGVLADGLSEYGGLYVGGHFHFVGNLFRGDTQSQYIARWGCITACRGDLNHDGSVNFGDINPFVAAMTNPAVYATWFHDPPLAEVDTDGTTSWFTAGLVLFLGDFNCDGSIGFPDINPFVQRVTLGVCSPDCGFLQQEEAGLNRMEGTSAAEGTGLLTPEDMAALLAENTAPGDYNGLQTRLAEFIAQEEDPDEAAYWQAVYDALVP